MMHLKRGESLTYGIRESLTLLRYKAWRFCESGRKGKR